VIIREDDHLCLDGNTKIITPYGKHLLKNIKIGDTVLTCGGWGKVLVSGCTNIEAQTYKVKLCCGKQLTGTEDHLIATSNGWTRLKDLRKGSEIIVCQSREMKSHIKGYGSGDILNQIVWKTGDIIGRMPVILKRVLSHFTEKYGKIITDKYQRVCTYIISMVMQLITGLKILKCYHTQNMEEYIMQGNVRKNKGCTLIEYDRKQRNGMGVKKGNYGIANMGKHAQRTDKEHKNRANGVTRYMMHGMRGINIVRQDANRQHMQSSIRKEYKNETSVVESIEKNKRMAVYNITTNIGDYVANGIIVHNCDALRMAIYSVSGGRVIEAV